MSKEEVHRQWERDWQEKVQQQNANLGDRALGFFGDPGIVRASVPIELVNSKGEVIRVIEPTE